MENKEENLRKAFHYIKTFYREVAQMLEDVEELMDKEKWESIGGSGITDNLSYSLDLPDRWMFQYIYRSFINKQTPNCMKGILVFFDVENNEFPTSIVCGKVNISDKEHDKWLVWRLWNQNKEKLKNLSGEEVELNGKSDEKEIKGKLFAIPLTKIKSKEDLKEKVVDKLLNLE